MDELVGIWKWFCPKWKGMLCLAGLRKTMKNIRIDDDPNEIWAGYGVFAIAFKTGVTAAYRDSAWAVWAIPVPHCVIVCRCIPTSPQHSPVPGSSNWHRLPAVLSLPLNVGSFVWAQIYNLKLVIRCGEWGAGSLFTGVLGWYWREAIVCT
jgi:hypothetical protein